MNIRTRAAAAFAAGAVIALGTTGTANAGQVSGAIFTTTVDGDIVNENVHYQAKEDVYLDGGPGPNAPSGAAGLPEGDYYFQVTDPSGKDLLSIDHISCRRVHVNEYGVIDWVYGGTTLEKIKGEWTAVSCQHNQGVDIDHSELGAITVQLYPYDNTPNNGGVYKAWMTPTQYYAGSTDLPECTNGQCNVNGEGWAPGNVHGFIPRYSKTDNYKVKARGQPPELTVLKFHDKDFDGAWDTDEEEVTGWAIDITDPSSVTNTEYTRVMVLTAEAGMYTVVEETPDGTLQTVAYLDSIVQSQYPTASKTVFVTVAGDSRETHEVIYGNVGLGSFKACKVFDQDGDGVPDAGEPPVVGWKFQLDGVDLSGAAVGPTVQMTGADGCTTFEDLLPGTYTVTELFPTTGDWIATGDTSATEDVVSSLSGSDISGSILSATFTNVCTDTADFGTKGYWHNKNGLQEITQADIDYVNTLDPYDDPTSYFNNGDEPFDGEFANGDPVKAAIGDGTWQGIEVAPEGSAKAEVSQFLVDPNAGGDPREQLAQQLLAFIFNTIHRLGGDGLIQLPDETWVLASDLIAAAITVWQSGTAAERNAMQELLNGFNESDALPYVPSVPCEVSYD